MKVNPSMPLPVPNDREPIHVRTVVCRGFRRPDRLWDIEGRITDVKSYAWTVGDRGLLEPGEPVHDMWIRLTIDDAFEVREVEAVTDSSPYGGCGGITPNFRRLVGLRIGKGWTRVVKERLGGVQGCTHLVELLGPVATTAFQTVHPILARERAERGERDVEPGRRPVLLDSCHMLASDGEVARREWPDHYTGDR